MSFRFFSFSALIATGAVLGHLYLYRRLIHDTARRRTARLVGLCALLPPTLALTFRRPLQRALPPELADLVANASYVWMGSALCLVVALLGLDAARFLVGIIQRVRTRGAEAPIDEERRRFVARTVAGGALLAGGGTAAWGTWRAWSPPRITEQVVRIPRLPKALEGFSIVQLTDIHVGPFIRRKFMDELVNRTNALKPDLVAITGDLVDGDVPTLGESVAALGHLRSRYGSYFVTGNHDYYSGDEAWTAFLEDLGIDVLRNRSKRIGDAGGSFDLLGVDDWSGWRRRNRPGYDLDRALAGHDPDRAAVLLAHQPANFTEAAARGVDLQISGHTHGGQIFPATVVIGFLWEHSAGLYQHGDSQIFVSRGCGFWGPPMRVGSPPEIVKLVLTT